MGLIRFLLTICVLSTHAGPVFGLKWMTGLNAVVVFFIISGFYMALILNEKYRGEKSSYSLFISNRLLRLMPAYWTVLFAHLILCCIGYTWKNDALTLHIYVDHVHDLSFGTWLTFIFCNLFIVGQDSLYYLHLMPSQGLIWSVKEGIPATWFMLMFPAWTLSIELLFYFMAPLILRKHKRLIALTIFFLSVILICRFSGIDLGSLTKSQFVSYLVYFLLGGIAWLVYHKIKKQNISFAVPKIIFTLYIILLLLFPYFYPESELQIQAFYFLSFLAIPFIFHLTKNWKWDSIIGEYSYPIYITHIMVNDILKLFGLEQTAHAELNLLLTLIVSFLLIKFVSNPVERLRQQRVKNL